MIKVAATVRVCVFYLPPIALAINKGLRRLVHDSMSPKAYKDCDNNFDADSTGIGDFSITVKCRGSQISCLLAATAATHPRQSVKDKVTDREQEGCASQEDGRCMLLGFFDMRSSIRR